MNSTGTANFAGFMLDPAARRLTRHGRVIHLTPKEFDLLALLAAHPGDAVSKEEIHHAVWHDAMVEEGSLTQTVSLLRKALSAYPGGNACIETVARHGYRLAVPVNWASARYARWSLRSVLWTAAIVLLALLSAWFYFASLLS